MASHTRGDGRGGRESQQSMLSGEQARGRQGREGLDLLEIGPEEPEGDLLELEEPGPLQARIKVIGVGGGGGNALNTMIRSGLAGVEFCAANTDSQALEHSLAPTRVQLGTSVTRGLGCGANPERGRDAALEDRDRLRDLLAGSDMVFITAGLGGGTGTGAAPVIAEVAREMGALTVAVVTRPFPFEGKVRTRYAERGLEELHRVVDTLITIPNQRLLALAGKNTALSSAFKLADDVLLNAVKGISDLITVHGLINLDFNDVRTIMNEMGQALMGTGIGRGESRARDAAQAAISSPLLEDVSIDGARGVLINITGGADMTLYEVNEASTLIQEAAHEEANIIFGAVIDEALKEGELRVTVIATGLDERDERTPRWEPDGPMRSSRFERGAAGGAPASASMSASAGAPAQAQAAADPLPPVPEPEPAPEEEPVAGEFLSPFEDELDVPAFLRKRAAQD
jgi:cell division protein FtsZ